MPTGIDFDLHFAPTGFESFFMCRVIVDDIQLTDDGRSWTINYGFTPLPSAIWITSLPNDYAENYKLEQKRLKKIQLEARLERWRRR